jgi:hypothetical protein
MPFPTRLNVSVRYRDSPGLTKICRMGWQFYSVLARRRGEMVNQSIQEEILNQLDKVPIEQQAQVLDFARALTSSTRHTFLNSLRSQKSLA